MKRLILAATAALCLLVGAALPAAAFNDQASAVVGAGGCAATIEVRNWNGVDGNDHGSVQITNISSGGRVCDFLGLRGDIVKCDGSSSLGPIIAGWNVPVGGHVYKQYDFSCNDWPYGGYVWSGHFELVENGASTGWIEMIGNGMCIPDNCIH